jgi:hypothetical protein
MIVLLRKTLILPVLVCTLAATGAPSAQARETPNALSASNTQPLYFSSTLSGGNEVPAGDPDGSAKSLVEIEGNRVTFAFTWKGIPAPTMGHIHVGGAGANGGVKVALFTSALPQTATGTAGVVEVEDAALVAAITAHPADFYLNLHTAEFPAGAVRGQLGPARRHRPALDLLPGLPLQTLMDGGQEVPAAGDPDGHGIAMVRASGHRIKYTVAWADIDRPNMGHIHAGAIGAGGPLVVPLFAGVAPEHIYAITGLVRDLDKSLVTRIRRVPTDYYVNVHNTEFPGGAIRGQLHR